MIYKHKPFRAIGVIFILLGVAFIFIYLSRDFFFFQIVLGIIFFIALLTILFRIAYVRVEIKNNEIHYYYRSIIRKINRVLTRDDVKNIYLEQKSNHRGVTSNQLVMETKQNEKLVLHPFYSPTTDILLLEQKIYKLPTSQEIEEEREEEQEEEKEQIKEHQKIWMFIEMSVKCPRCEGSVNINGPYIEFICPHCQSVIDFNPEKWRDMFEDIRDEVVEEIEPGHGTKSTVMGVFNAQMFYGRMIPYCKKCKQDFNVEQAFRDKEYINCLNCGEKVSVFSPPNWFESVISGSFVIIDAFPEQVKDSTSDKTKPITINCPKCGSNLVINGDDRIKDCSHCGISYYIPDDVWKKFHPAPVKNRWFIGFET